MKKTMIKNPFNYQGGKYKILNDLQKLFPTEISTFVDVFGGSGEVVLNDTTAVEKIYNEKCKEMTVLMSFLKKKKSFIKDVDTVISQFELSKTNKEGFNILREEYNKLVAADKQYTYIGSLYFFCLMAHSFNNQIGFNSKKEFNVAFGANKSCFNNKMRDNLSEYIYNLTNSDLTILNKSFEEILIQCDDFKDNSFFYCDPPYFITVGGYERTKELSWNEGKERLLLLLLDNLNEKGYKFGLSNVIDHKGKSNDILKEWSKKYNVYYIDRDYSNCNYQTGKSGDASSVEVYICNYQ